MTYSQSSILLYVVGLLLLVAEVFLPTHGAVGLMGAVSILAAIGYCFAIHAWLGFGVLFVSVLSAPFVFALAVRIFPRTFIGRHLVLPLVEVRIPPITVQIGQTGVTISELRPMGVCEFAEQRVEAVSEFGSIPPGRKVQVITLNNRQPVVRAV